MDGFVLRDARPDDADALALIERVQGWYTQLYGAPDRDPLDAEAFTAPRGVFLIGECDGTAVAMGGWSRIEHDGAPAAKLRRMYVVPEAQRRGLAGRVLDELERRAAAAGLPRVVLETGSPQRAAVAFYRARCYEDVTPFGFYARVEGAVHLGKALRTS